MISDAQISDAIWQMAQDRTPDKSLCPSEVARALASDWRALMPRIRDVASNMPQIEATQRGALVDPKQAKGPIRLRLARTSR